MVETAAVALAWGAALEHDHRGDGVVPPRLEMSKHSKREREREREREERETGAAGRPGGARAGAFVERVDAGLAAALGAQPLLVEREAGVALGELEDAALVAALGRAHLDGAVAAAGEGLGERPDLVV